MLKKFRQVFVFVCGILREDASILFAQIGEKLKSDWDWFKCNEAKADFFIESWRESGNAEGMANTLCSFLPFPRVVHLPCIRVDEYEDQDWGVDQDWTLLRVLLFCRQFSKIEAPDEIRLGPFRGAPVFIYSSEVRDLASLPKLKFLNLFNCFFNVEPAHTLFQILPEFASLTELVLPDIPEMTDWEIVADALTTSKTLERVECFLLGERGEGWAKALDAGLSADTPLSSVNLTICGPMSETALQAFENLFFNKSLSSVSAIVKGDLSHSLAVTLSRALAGATAVKSLDLSIFGKLSFYCGNLIERGIVNNNSLSNLVLSLRGELPDNWQAIVENLNVQLAQKSTVTFKIHPNTFSPVTATQLTDFRPCVIEYGLFEQESVTLSVWGELTVDGAEALYNVLPFTSVCHVTLNIHGKLTDNFLHCTARHVDKKKPLCSITINTWEQLTNEGKALFKELELDKNPAVTLNVCEVLVPSDESSDDKIVCIDNPKSLIKLLEEAGNTGQENLTVRINVQSDDSTCDFSDDSTGRGWKDNLARNCSLTSLTLTINHFSPRRTGLSLTLFGCLEDCISLKSLNLTLNEYNNELKDTYTSFLRKGLERITSLISLTLTLNVYNRLCDVRDDDNRGENCYCPIISVDSFTLTINDFSSSGGWGVGSGVLWSNFKSLTTFNVTLNRCDESSVVYDLPILLDEWMNADSLRTLRLKINDAQLRSGCRGYDFSKFVLKIPSLELIELTIIRYGVVGSSLETLKWEKQ